MTSKEMDNPYYRPGTSSVVSDLTQPTVASMASITTSAASSSCTTVAGETVAGEPPTKKKNAVDFRAKSTKSASKSKINHYDKVCEDCDSIPNFKEIGDMIRSLFVGAVDAEGNVNANAKDVGERLSNDMSIAVKEYAFFVAEQEVGGDFFWKHPQLVDTCKRSLTTLIMSSSKATVPSQFPFSVTSR